MDTLRQDLVHAVRSLWKSPGYAAVTILTLALGIGANSAIFSVINGVLLRPLPYPEPSRLLFITSQFPVAQWHDVIADPTVADAILDRLVHNAYRLEFGGKSMRDPKNPSEKQS